MHDTVLPTLREAAHRGLCCPTLAEVNNPDAATVLPSPYQRPVAPNVLTHLGQDATAWLVDPPENPPGSVKPKLSCWTHLADPPGSCSESVA